MDQNHKQYLDSLGSLCFIQKTFFNFFFQNFFFKIKMFFSKFFSMNLVSNIFFKLKKTKQFFKIFFSKLFFKICFPNCSQKKIIFWPKFFWKTFFYSIPLSFLWDLSLSHAACFHSALLNTSREKGITPSPR